MTKYFCKCGNIIDDGIAGLCIPPPDCPDMTIFNFWKHDTGHIDIPSKFGLSEIKIVGRWKK